MNLPCFGTDSSRSGKPVSVTTNRNHVHHLLWALVIHGVMIFCVELHLELRDYIVEYSGRKKEHLMQLEVLWIRGQWRTWPQQSY